MTAKSISAMFMVGVCSVIVGLGSPATADEKDEINKFYRSVVQTVKKPIHMKELTELVEKEPEVARRCLAICGQKAKSGGDQAEALCLIHDELAVAVILASRAPKCDVECWRQVGKLLTPAHEDDDQIFCLERLTAACPRTGEAYGLLGDLYLKQRRCGMAAKAYQTSVELTGDKDSQELLQEARECKDEYAAQRPIRYAQVKSLVGGEKTMAPQRATVRKALIGNSIQRQVRFGEWSAKIDDQFLPDLKVIGEGLRDELPTHPDIRLLIEGHSDKRGDPARNVQISKDRAESIKAYLVKNYAIDPSRLVTEGYGPSRPYSPEENEAGYALNRRVEFKKVDSAK